MSVELTDLQQRTAGRQPVSIVAMLKNTSRRSVRTKGTLVIYDAAGRTLSQTPVPDVPVLPESGARSGDRRLDPDKDSRARPGRLPRRGQD